jgi:hypothetical protein
VRQQQSVQDMKQRDALCQLQAEGLGQAGAWR